MIFTSRDLNLVVFVDRSVGSLYFYSIERIPQQEKTYSTAKNAMEQAKQGLLSPAQHLSKILTGGFDFSLKLEFSSKLSSTPTPQTPSSQTPNSNVNTNANTNNVKRLFSKTIKCFLTHDKLDQPMICIHSVDSKKLDCFQIKQHNSNSKKVSTNFEISPLMSLPALSAIPIASSRLSALVRKIL